MTSVWDYSKASGTDLLVLLVLADMANDEGECWPSMATIARKSRLEPRNARHRIRALETLEEVLVIRGGGRSSSKGGLRSNRYRVTVHMEADADTDASVLITDADRDASVLITDEADTDASILQIRTPASSPIRTPASAEPSGEPLLKRPPNPHGRAVGDPGRKRGMRGTGTSPRELRAAGNAHRESVKAQGESERLVKAIPETYADHPEIAKERIRQAFANDPERCQRSLDHLATLSPIVTTVTSSPGVQSDRDQVWVNATTDALAAEAR
jgi:hypothetical protein